MNDLVEIQRTRIREARLPREMYYLKLLTSLTQPSSHFPTKEDLKRTFSDELTTTLDTLFNTSSELCAEYDVVDIMQRKINSDEELQKLRLDVDEFLKNTEMVVQIFEVKIFLLESFAKQHRKIIPFDKLAELHKEIMLAHNEKWIQQTHVTELWSDGEITSQKGGELYGHRSVFTHAHSVNETFEWTLAIKNGNGQSYVILESTDVAQVFRARMKLLASN